MFTLLFAVSISHALGTGDVWFEMKSNSHYRLCVHQTLLGPLQANVHRETRTNNSKNPAFQKRSLFGKGDSQAELRCGQSLDETPVAGDNEQTKAHACCKPTAQEQSNDLRTFTRIVQDIRNFFRRRPCGKRDLS